MPHSRGDLIANVLLYTPFGFFSVQSLRRWSSVTQLLLVTCAGLALSASIEMAQFYDIGRDSALSDVCTNTAGALVGAAAGIVLSRELRLPLVGGMEWRPFVVLLLASWLGYRLFPYVPVIDLHKYWNALKPLVFAPALPLLDLYRHTVIWLALAVLLEALFGVARGRLAIFLLVPGVLFARILIVGVVLSPAEVIGGVVALLLWIALLSRLRIRSALVAALFAGVVTIQGLDPFRFTATARSFGWIPFLSFMQGSLEVNIRSFFEKVFTYGGLTWLLTRAGWPPSLAAALGGALVLCLRVAQVYIPGRSAEITDVVVLFALAAIMKLMGEEPARQVSALGR